MIEDTKLTNDTNSLAKDFAKDPVFEKPIAGGFESPGTSNTSTRQQVPDSFYRGMNLDLQVLQSQFTIDIGAVFHNFMSFDTKGMLSNKICHELMTWEINTTQRQTVLMYTIAFANLDKLKPSVDDITESLTQYFGDPVDQPDERHDERHNQAKMIIEAWWQKVSNHPDKPVPYHWFDVNAELNIQFTHIAMCLLSMS
jgi:hypothetical protein